MCDLSNRSPQDTQSAWPTASLALPWEGKTPQSSSGGESLWYSTASLVLVYHLLRLVWGWQACPGLCPEGGLAGSLALQRGWTDLGVRSLLRPQRTVTTDGLIRVLNAAALRIVHRIQ